jgi:hypothetical protein
MQELDAGSGGVRRGLIVIAAGMGYGKTKPGTNARAAREDRVTHRRGEKRWP